MLAETSAELGSEGITQPLSPAVVLIVYRAHILEHKVQAYGQGFARVYNLRWSAFARQVAPSILNFYEKTPVGLKNKSVLDLCCGAGHLAVQFLENGYAVVGVDLSEHMLHYARENASKYVDSGQVRFVRADASDFALDERFGLVVATYDSLNHLENEQALTSCSRCVHAVCEGYFIFDLNTRRGLRNWNGVRVDDGDAEAMVITRGIYDERSDRAWMKISGFVAAPGGTYERFEETVYNTAFDMARVRELLLDVGWRSVRFARVRDLWAPLDEPEEEGRVFIVASK